jgi:hypothetical protein
MTRLAGRLGWQPEGDGARPCSCWHCAALLCLFFFYHLFSILRQSLRELRRRFARGDSSTAVVHAVAGGALHTADLRGRAARCVPLRAL